MRKLIFTKYILVYLIAISSAILLIGDIFNIVLFQFKLGVFGDITFLITTAITFLVLPIFFVYILPLSIFNVIIKNTKSLLLVYCFNSFLLLAIIMLSMLLF